MQEVSLASGETVFRAQEAGTHLYIIGNGSVDIVSYGSDGVEKVCLPCMTSLLYACKLTPSLEVQFHSTPACGLTRHWHIHRLGPLQNVSSLSEHLAMRSFHHGA